MSTPAEDALYASLTEIEDLERLSRIGLSMEAIPNERMQQVVEWAIDYYFSSGRRSAPSRQLLLDNWADELEAADVELLPEDQERDTIEAAVEHLNGILADHQFQTFLKESATAMAMAPTTQKVEVMTELTGSLFAVTQSLQDHSSMIEATQGFQDSFNAYEAREESGHSVSGMTFGFPPVDTHMGGIRAGELAILAAGPKVGKSYMLGSVGLNEWMRGRRTVLFSLENSVEMTYDRLVCMANAVSAREYQRGLLSGPAKEKVTQFIKTDLEDLKRYLVVISPGEKARTPEMLVRQAAMLGADSILVDQLTHVVHPNPGRKARHELFNENVHEFKNLISSGRERYPLLLAHQINRDGVKAAQKSGFHEMYHLAESAGVERAADWILSLYQGKADRTARSAVLQILAARREDTKNWRMLWHVESAGRRVMSEVSLDS